MYTGTALLMNSYNPLFFLQISGSPPSVFSNLRPKLHGRISTCMWTSLIPRLKNIPAGGGFYPINWEKTRVLGDVIHPLLWQFWVWVYMQTLYDSFRCTCSREDKLEAFVNTTYFWGWSPLPTFLSLVSLVPRPYVCSMVIYVISFWVQVINQKGIFYT